MEVRTQTIKLECCDHQKKMTDENKVTSELPSGNDPGEDLVGSKIKVWCPDDKKFYEGVVESFDPNIKKHKVVYLEGDGEILFLKEERWEIVEGHTVAEKINVHTKHQDRKKKKKVVHSLKFNASRNSTRAAEDGLLEAAAHCANNAENKKYATNDLLNCVSPEFSAILNTVCTERIADFNVDEACIKKDSVQDNDKMFRESALLLQISFMKYFLQTQYIIKTSDKELQVIRTELNAAKEKNNILEAENEDYKKALKMAKAELKHLHKVVASSSAVGTVPTPNPVEPHVNGLDASWNVAVRLENLEGNLFGLSKLLIYSFSFFFFFFQQGNNLNLLALVKIFASLVLYRISMCYITSFDCKCMLLSF
ncbi:hypothetical protein AQUCO_00300062v1 [Aquilegia coerulea]|uniref:Tudor domain-containing protein n=1 Tax=Aquilegia coerulea TaxID=218851 RepID=A0A2G5EX46_AQUCA|nr:hypothetical protein AQUCO_00300062v1 [Aquilegia coerulea]